MPSFTSILALFQRRKPLLWGVFALLLAGTLLLPAPFAAAAAALLSCTATGVLIHCVHQKAWTHPWRLSQPLHTLHHLTIQGDLLVGSRRMLQAHLPFDAVPQPRLRSGALLWASAATVTHTLADPADQAAILAAVKPLGFLPEPFLARCPILDAVEVSGQKGYIVRDGSGMRAYFLGDPASLLAACRSVWEQDERPITPDDSRRLPASRPGLYGFATAYVDQHGTGPMTYLGSLCIGPAVNELACSTLKQLAQSWPVHVTPPAAAPELAEDVCSLSTAAVQSCTLQIARQETGANCLVTDEIQQDLHQLLLKGYSLSAAQEARIRRLVGFHTIVLIMALAWGLPFWAGLAAGVWMLPHCLLSSQEERNAPPPMLLSLITLWSILWPLAAGAFLGYTVPDGASDCLLLAFAAAIAGLALLPAPFLHRLHPLQGKLLIPLSVLCLAALWLVLRPPLIAGLFGLLAGALLPVGIALMAVRFACSKFSGHCS